MSWSQATDSYVESIVGSAMDVGGQPGGRRSGETHGGIGDQDEVVAKAQETYTGPTASSRHAPTAAPAAITAEAAAAASVEAADDKSTAQRAAVRPING